MCGRSRSLDAEEALGAGGYRIARCVRAGGSSVDALYSSLVIV